MKLTFNDFVIVLTKIMVHMGKFKFMLIVVSSAVLIKQGTTVYGKGMSHQIRFKTIAWDTRNFKFGAEGRGQEIIKRLSYVRACVRPFVTFLHKP